MQVSFLTVGIVRRPTIFAIRAWVPIVAAGQPAQKYVPSYSRPEMSSFGACAIKKRQRLN
jgi:hypothetical protein